VRTGWLLRRGEVLASAEMATGVLERSRGLVGRRSFEGVLLLDRTRSIHTFGVPYSIDVAFLDKQLVVLDHLAVARWRLTRPRWRGHMVLEAPRGSFDRWGLRVGDALEFRETP
jgi:uncharacterized protein